jgi:hypothetical protein
MNSAAAPGRSGGNRSRAWRSSTRGDVADLGGVSAAGGQPLPDLLDLVTVADQQRSDVGVGDVGLASFGQVSDERRVLPGGGAAEGVPGRVVDGGGPRADDAGARGGRLPRPGRVDQRDLDAQPAGGVRAGRADDSGTHDDQPHGKGLRYSQEAGLTGRATDRETIPAAASWHTGHHAG